MNKVIEILIVEDSPTQIEHLKYLLEEQGYAVTPTTNGRQALEVARARKPTIIISDIMMPEMDGYALCRTIKSDAALKDIPIILVTDLNSPQDVIMGLQCCADNFITKPYDTQFLLARITQSLRNKELRANQQFDAAVEIELANQRFTITAERHQILDLLIPTYEEAVRLNQKLRDQQKELAEQIQERTAANERLLIEVAERKRAEEELSKQTSILKSVLTSMGEGVVVADLDGKFLIWNPAAESLVGYGQMNVPMEEWSKQYGVFLPDQVTPYPSDQLPLAKAMRGEPVDGDEQFLRNAHTPHGIWLSVTGRPLQNEAGAQLGGVVVFRNITEHKRAEDALRRTHAELEMRVQERTAELQQKNRDLETLLYVTSHDLREPLRAIENFSRLVHDRYADRLDDKGKDFLRRVVRGAQRMDRLMTDLLALSRVQRMELPAGDVEGASLVQEALRQLEGRIKETGARVRVANDLPRLRVNKTWATQGISNLIANALKFRRDGEAPDIEIAPYRPIENSGVGIGLIVRDRGPGLAPEHAERIFQLFQRAVGREVEGTGAGLAIVRQVAERHGGRAWVRPREGGGSEFILTFGTPHASERT